jgi:hypothetical protein
MCVVFAFAALVVEGEKECTHLLPVPLPDRCNRTVRSRIYDDSESIENISSMLAAAGIGESDRPTVLIVGAGHSGTTTVAVEFLKIGWVAGKASAQHHESKMVVHANTLLLQRTSLNTVNVNTEDSMVQCANAANSTYAVGRCMISENINLHKNWISYPRPAVLKDPRFVYTLHLWVDIFENEPVPLLIHVRRDQVSEFSHLSLSSFFKASPP